MSRIAIVPNPAHRPKKVIAVTPEQLISAMAQAQCTKIEICSRLGIGMVLFDQTPTYLDLFIAGKSYGKAKLRQKLVAVAMEGNQQVLIFLGKTLLGMKETSALELSGPDGAPIEMSTVDAKQRLTDLLAVEAARRSTDTIPSDTH